MSLLARISSKHNEHCPRYYLFCWTNWKRSDTKPKKLSCCCRNQFNTAIASAISESANGCGSKGAKHTGSIYITLWIQKLLRVGGWIRSKTVFQSPDFRSWIVLRINSQCVWNNSLKSSLLSALKLSETTATQILESVFDKNRLSIGPSTQVSDGLTDFDKYYSLQDTFEQNSTTQRPSNALRKVRKPPDIQDSTL